MESTWNGDGLHMEWVYSMVIPYGIHSVHGMRKWLEPQPKAIPWIPYGMTGGVHMESIGSPLE